MPYSLLRPLLFKTDPEWIHDIALKMLSRTPMASLLTLFHDVPRKPVKLWMLNFRNPLGLAAGFDKDAVALPAWEKLGFGFVEIGTVTPMPQAGNPKPRIFRIPSHQAVINRMGFPNTGMDAVAKNLQNYRATHPPLDFPIGVNLGKGKDTPLENAADDYLTCFKKFYNLGDYFVVNISSPNTPGLRTLQQPQHLNAILAALQQFNRARANKPLLVKIAPDLSNDDILKILEVITANYLSGIVATNTTLDHTGMPIQQQGGLSGRPLTAKSTEIVRFIAEETDGKLPIIAVGGVFTQADYQEKLDAGATLVQAYTGFVYQGPLIAHQILK